MTEFPFDDLIRLLETVVAGLPNFAGLIIALVCMFLIAAMAINPREDDCDDEDK